MSIPSGDSPLSYPTDDDVAFDGDYIVVPIVEGDPSRARSIALDVESETRSELVFARLETLDNGTDGGGHAAAGPPSGDRGDSLPDEVTSRTVTGSGRTVVDALEDAVEGLSVGTIVLENGHRVDLADLVLGDTTTRLVDRIGSDVFVVTDPSSRREISSILVPVGDGPYSALALSLAEVMARAHDAWIDVYHVVDPDASADDRRRAERYVRSCADRFDEFDRVDTWVHEAPDVSDAIIEQTEYYDLTVLGSPTKGRLRRFLFGSTTDDVETDARNTVVTVRGP